MKIDRRNPVHWYRFLHFSFNTVLALLLTLFKQPVRHRIVLYGHKLNGNLKALYEYYQRNESEWEVCYLSLDPVYVTLLRSQGIQVLSALSLMDMLIVCRARCIVTDHGPLCLLPLAWLSKYILIDVWHGIPYKGFDEKDFQLHHQYNYIFVTSELLKRIYVERFGFDDHQVVITGYGRTDHLVRQDFDLPELRRKYGISQEFSKVVMYAPTWQHDDPDRSLAPFGLAIDDFLYIFNKFASDNDLQIILRTHLNTIAYAKMYSNIRHLPTSGYPDTEELLYISDVLICDWSSIAFDFLLLERPVLFIDTEPPFSKGLTLGRDFRFGPLVNDMNELGKTLQAACDTPSIIVESSRRGMQSVRRKVYSRFADGFASKRYAQFIERVA